MNALDHRCGTCARFVRVIERVDENGEVTRAGECLLGVWPAPLYETNTCGEWVQKGTLGKGGPRGGSRSETPFAEARSAEGGARGANAPRTRLTKALPLLLAVAAITACGPAALDTSLEMKEAPRRPDGVLLEPSPAIPPPEDKGHAQDGVLALRQPISDQQVADVAREYVRSFARPGGPVSALPLTDDAVKLEDNGRSSPKSALITFANERWSQHRQDYQALHRDIVRADHLERWGHDDIGPRSDPPRPSEMRDGDVLTRIPLDPVVSTAGDPLFRNTLILLLRRGPDRQLKIAGIGETDSP